MRIINTIFRIIRYTYRKSNQHMCHFLTLIILKLNLVDYGKNFRSYGLPIIDVSTSGKMKIGNNVTFNNGWNYNRIGRNQRCCFVANFGGQIVIGDNVGLSGVAIVSHKSVVIGNNVLIGGNTAIYDTDFHPLNITLRKAGNHQSLASKAEVVIEDGAFIGAHSTILKGVRIGENSVVGACSLVVKNVPKNEVWGGNPAKFIKSLC